MSLCVQCNWHRHDEADCPRVVPTGDGYCRQGHPLTSDNVYRDRHGKARCRTCVRIATANGIRGVRGVGNNGMS